MTDANNKRVLREIEGDNPHPQVKITPEVQRLIDKGLISEEEAKSALAEGRTPKILTEW